MLCYSLFICFSLLTSCGGNETGSRVSSAVMVKDTAFLAQSDNGRMALISELYKLKEVFISGDRNRVADLFSFPAPDTMLSVYLDDSTFSKRLKDNNEQFSREIFLEFYPLLSNAMWLQEMDSLFRVLPLDSLANRDTLERYFPVTGEPCIRYYSITIEGESVVIVTGVDSSKDYINPETKEKEIHSEECESAMVWIFRFNGRKLTLKQHTGVG